MLYPAQQGVALSFFHPVRDIGGNYVAGQAGSVTKALLGPDRLAATAGELAAVTLSDYATGWVKVTITEPRLGEYTLTLTNPSAPTADGRVEDYGVMVLAGLTPSATLLTSLDRVRTRLQLKKPNTSPAVPIQPGDAHDFDTLIALLISEVSDDYQGMLGRTFVDQAYTAFLDGSGTPHLVLPAGPVTSFTSLNSVEYTDDGAGGVTETLTVVPRHTYVVAGLANQPRFYGRGRVDLLGGAYFPRGPRRYKAVFGAGFATIPESVVGLATEAVVYRLMTRDTGHLLSQSQGDGSISYLRPQQMVEFREGRLGAFMLEAA